MNRGQLKTRVSRILGFKLGPSDDTINDTQLVEELLNEAVLDILARTRVHVRRLDIELGAGDTDYEIDTEILRLWSVFRGETLVEEDKDFLTDLGYAFVGYNRIVFGRMGAGTGDKVTFFWTPRPDPMSGDADDPADVNFGKVPPEFHLAIVNYACWHMADRTGDAQAQRGEHYRVLYEGQDGMAGPGTSLGKIKTATNTRSGSATRITRTRPSPVSDRDASFWQG